MLPLASVENVEDLAQLVLLLVGGAGAGVAAWLLARPRPALALALVLVLHRPRRVEELLQLAAIQPHPAAARAHVDLDLAAAHLLHALVAVRAHQQRHRASPPGQDAP
jgi:hypothetical protein